jgi:hypothetical protein
MIVIEQPAGVPWLVAHDAGTRVIAFTVAVPRERPPQRGVD